MRSFAFWRIITNISELIDPSSQSNGIFGDEPAKLRIIESGAVIEQTRH